MDWIIYAATLPPRTITRQLESSAADFSRDLDGRVTALNRSALRLPVWSRNQTIPDPATKLIGKHST